MNVLFEQKTKETKATHKEEATENAFYVSIGNTEWTIPETSVYSVLTQAEVIHIPQQPDYIVGILVYQGLILPVIDLAALFELQANRKFGGFVLIIHHKSSQFALLVDSLIMQQELCLVNDQNTSLWQGLQFSLFVKGLVKQQGQHYFLLDLTGLIEYTQPKIE